jgi:phosphoribosyl-ATP pyrophosphohydrolase/phosphoribosyl-AMP cyclohydrolase
MFDLSQLDFTKDAGFVTVVAQDAGTGLVLTVGRADRNAIVESLSTGELQYQSREHGRWQRHNAVAAPQRVVSLACDCDGDALLARVVPSGPACHTGASSCFSGPEDHDARTADSANAAASDRARDAMSDHRLEQLGEEAAGLITLHAANDLAAATREVTSLVYRALAALCAAGGSLAEVQGQLALRDSPQSSPLAARTVAVDR